MATLAGPISYAVFDFGGGGNYIIRLDYDGAGNIIYQGWAPAGRATSDANWRIQQNTYNASNQLISTAFPIGSPAFAHIWDNRATLSYS